MNKDNKAIIIKQDIQMMVCMDWICENIKK